MTLQQLENPPTAQPNIKASRWELQKGAQAQERCSTWWTLPGSSRKTVLMDSCMHYQIFPLYLWLHPASGALPVSITYQSPEELETSSPQRHAEDQEII